MNIFKLIIGVALICLGVAYIFFAYNKAKENKEYDSFNLFYDAKIIFGVIVFIMIGISLVYKALKNL